MEYVDLNVQTGKKQNKMRFLITDLGHEDLILGYPWLATFEPKFSWADGTINVENLPVIVRSLDWETRLTKTTISQIMAELVSIQERTHIVEELEEECFTISTRLVQEAHQYQQEVEVPKEYKQHSRVFSEEESHSFPPSRPWDHAIDLKEGAPEAINCKIIPTTMEEDEALKKFIKEQLERGYIWKSKSPYASAFFFIKKKDGKLRPIQDYQKLNQYTIRNKYPLPLIPELITQVKDTNIFSKFDIHWGYNNIRIKDGDQHKAAFKTKYGLYEPNIMFFGLTNSPATFQAMMDHILQPWAEKWALEDVNGSWCMDNVLVASRNKKKHQQATHELLDILEANDLFLKPEKCIWEQPRVDYLGLILEEGVTCMDLAKVAGIATWPTPTSVKQVQSFLGFCNFYQPFIYQFSHIARPLNELTRKDTPWIWERRQQEAFETLRKRITSEPVLKQPQLDQQFEVEVDTSGYAIGAVLMARDEKGKRHPVAYFSSTLNEAKRNYNIYTLELYTIVRVLRHWRPFLAGSPHKIIIHMDHVNLQYWKEPQKINWRIAQEVVELSEYNIKLKNIPGRENGRADMLSRRPDYNQGGEDNQDVVVLSEKICIRSGTISYIPEEPPQQDKEIIRQWAGTHDLKKINGEWWKDRCKVITSKGPDKHKNIQAYHDVLAYGHPGINRTRDLVAKYYWWPQLAKDVQEYVKGCTQCQQNKVNTRPQKAPLNPITLAIGALPFQTISMDFIVKLPELAGYNSILTITDHDCTKMLIAIPCREMITAEGVAELFLRQIFPRFGMPSKIISDRDPRFVSKFMKELCRLMGITQNVSTAYHPRTDGQSERSNQWLEQYL